VRDIPRSLSDDGAESSTRVRRGGPRCRACREDLNLDMPRALDCFFEVKRGSPNAAAASVCAVSNAERRSALLARAACLCRRHRRGFQHHGITKLSRRRALLPRMNAAARLFPERSERRLRQPHDAHSSSSP
jgi:hypothetical protein